MNSYATEHAYVHAVFVGSNGDDTKGLYGRLADHGPAGEVALNLFRAQKASDRPKVYRGRRYKGAAYDRKQWAMGNLTAILGWHADSLGIRWGWGVDQQQAMHSHVLYVDIPTGQCSFHTAQRGTGPDYPGQWDGVRDAVPSRIFIWCASLLSGQAVPA